MVGRVVRVVGGAVQAMRRRGLLAATLLAVCGAACLVPREQGEFFWADIDGWAALFGVVSCVAIIFVSKLLGKQGRIMRDEDYYD